MTKPLNLRARQTMVGKDKTRDKLRREAERLRAAAERLRAMSSGRPGSAAEAEARRLERRADQLVKEAAGGGGSPKAR